MGCHVHSPNKEQKSGNCHDQGPYPPTQAPYARMPLAAQSRHTCIFSLCHRCKAAQSAGKNALLGASMLTRPGRMLSEHLAGVVGGLGMAPGANIGAEAAVLEAVHGSAPAIAGKGVANPTALLLTATLNIDNVRTGDLGGKATTAEFTRALVSRIANG